MGICPSFCKPERLRFLSGRESWKTPSDPPPPYSEYPQSWHEDELWYQENRDLRRQQRDVAPTNVVVVHTRHVVRRSRHRGHGPHRYGSPRHGSTRHHGPSRHISRDGHRHRVRHQRRHRR